MITEKLRYHQSRNLKKKCIFYDGIHHKNFTILNVVEDSKKNS